MNEKYTLLFRVVFIIYVLVISLLAFTPATDVPDINISDKIQHLVSFVVLAFFADFAFPNLKCRSGLLVALFSYGVFIELVQIMLPTRDFSWLDIVADSLGILLYKLVREVPRYLGVKTMG